MTRCQDIEHLLSEYVDGDLSEQDAGAVRTHLSSCAECAGVALDLERLKSSARAMGPVAPPPSLRERIAALLPPGDQVDSTVESSPALVRWPWLAAAAALIVLAGVAAVMGPLRSNGGASPVVDSSPTGLAAVAAELDLAVRHYERAITELEAINPADDGLSPDVATAIRASLVTLDRAITESRQVLIGDPSDELARVMLFEALRRKVDLLQSAALMAGDGANNPDGPVVPIRNNGSES